MKLSIHEKRTLGLKSIPRKSGERLIPSHVINSYVQGLSINNIAYQNGVSEPHIRKLLEVNSIPIRNQKQASRLSSNHQPKGST